MNWVWTSVVPILVLFPPFRGLIECKLADCVPPPPAMTTTWTAGEASCTRNGTTQQCMAVSDSNFPCPGCPNCSAPTPWAQVAAFNNSFVP